MSSDNEQQQLAEIAGAKIKRIVGSPSIDLFLTVYGQFAFGTAVVLVIWFVIMAPFIEQQRLDFDRYSELNKQQGINNIAAEATARMLHETAIIVDRASQRMERMSENNDK